MLKLWGPHDQTTPRASDRANPFDSISVKSNAGGLGHSSGGSHLSLSSLAAASGTRTPTLTAGPTTHLSLHAPEFNQLAMPQLKAPPLMRNQTAASAASVLSTTSANGTNANASPANSGQSRGQLHVKLIQARGLNVRSSRARPYVVVQFEHNEFVSREPTTDTDKEVKGVPQPLSRNSSSTALASLAASGIARAFEAASRARSSTGPNLTPQPSSAVSGTSSPSPFGSGLSPHNPVWKHEVSFDVTSDQSTITFTVYDRAEEEEVFLGMLEVKPVLKHELTVDQWLKLQAREDNQQVKGEIRVQITYEQYKTKRQLTPRDFEFMKLIGRGTFGRVFQVRKKDTRRIYAMKILSKKEIIAKKEVAHTIGERKILQASLDCPFLVGLKFSFQTASELYLVTDFKSGGELFWHLQKETRFSEERARFYIAELVLALEHLHKYDIVYRDLKPENILLDATGHVALCDFGLSKPDLGSDQLTNTFCGTTEYLAPEVLLDDSGYSKLVDFWSLGVLLFEMCCGWSPFYAEDTQTMYRNICFGKIRFPRGVIGEDGKQFVKGLLNRNPKHRLGAQNDAEDLKQHPFFKTIDWKALALKQVTPPFKPVVESDESTANFDPEFTEADLREHGIDFDDETEDEDDQGLTMTGSQGSNGTSLTSASAGTRNGGNQSQRPGLEIIKQHKGDKKKGAKGGHPSSPGLTSSVQENFRGFTYMGESMIGQAAGLLGEDREADKQWNDEEAVEEKEGEDDDDAWEDEDDSSPKGRYQNRRRESDLLMDE
ncbi:hypothetical protein FRC03_006484 [Tulasnella sp. 419]|nr:hypothetical protein FRC03_006484 [Tulasnella sp. 419]